MLNIFPQVLFADIPFFELGNEDCYRNTYRTWHTGLCNFCIWNGITSIHSDKRVVSIDTSGFAEGNEKLKKIQYFNVLTWVWEQASVNRNERCIIVADEAYLTIAQRVPTAFISMRNMAKRGRKYNVS